MANPYKILTFLTASKDAVFQEKLTVIGETNLNGNVNLGDSSSDNVVATGKVTASSGLNVSSGFTSTGGASIGGVANFTQTGAGAFDFAGSGSIQGKLFVYGGIEVQGNITYLNTTNLDVIDQRITIAKNASDYSNDPGVYVGSDTSPIASFNIRNSDKAWVISGSTGLSYSGLVIVATSSADLTNIGSGLVTSQEFNVEKVFRAIDSKLATATTISTISNVYSSLRYHATGTLDGSGNKVLDLLSLKGSKFADTELDYVTVNVMVREDNTKSWTNDLVSVYVTGSAGGVQVTIDAPGAPGWLYKIVAVNEHNTMFN
jgi:hypothetical protein